MANKDVLASPTSFDRIRQSSLKEGLSPPRGGLSGASHQPGIFTLTLIICAGNTREVAKEPSSPLYPNRTVVLAYSLPVAGQLLSFAITT